MPYLGKSPSSGVRTRFVYAATSGQTSFSGNDSAGISLAYDDNLYLDVYQNGVLLKPVTDYAATTGTSVVLTTGATTDDVVEMIVYDTFAVADTVSAKDGGTFAGAVSFASGASFGDSDKSQFGASNDLQIFHDGSNSFINNTVTGALSIKSDDINLMSSASQNMAVLTEGGAVTLYHNNSAKLATASTGVDITGAFTATAASTITTSDNSNNLTLTSTDADANTGPNLVMTRASGSPADNDAIGELTFNFNNDAAENTVGTRWRNFIIDASNGTEDAAFDIFSMRGGSLTSILNYDASTIIVNDGGANIDFRIESSGNANMFAVNAGNNSVMIGDSTGANYSDGGLFVRHAGGANNASLCVVNGTTSGTLRLVDFFGGTSTSRVGSIQVESGSVAFNTSSDYRLKENVNYTWDATTRLKQLKPVQFNWISDDTNTAIDGFLAHEVSSIVPSAISGEKDEVWTDGSPMYQQIDQSKLVPLLVKTIQELEARIAALEE